jgi:DNA-binding NtrC family response regulator
MITKKYLTKVFIVEDDQMFATAVKFRLEKDGEFEVTVFPSGKEFISNLYQNPDIVTIDYHLPDMSGLELLKEITAYNKDIVPIIVSGQEEVEVVVQTYRNGAKDYITKNSNATIELLNSIKNFSIQTNLRKEVDELKTSIADRAKYKTMVGESKPVLQILRMIQKVEKTNMMVMITGESGTGKEVVAQLIHFNSNRRRDPFVPINMAAIPEELIESELFGHEKGAFTGADSRRIGKFEEAHNGTIFLDEIGEMDMALQARLLRVLQESTITRVGSNKEIKLNVRVLAATNKNLLQMVKNGKFREDLFYRLQGFLLHLPPLRERGNDIILLARQFLREFSETNRLGPKVLNHSALQSLLEYTWPGNVRELKSVIERAAIISEGDQVMEEDLIFSSVLC